MGYMFANCLSLINLDLSNFDTQNVINMGNMFSNCPSLKNIDLSNFNTQNSTKVSDLFYSCSSLKKENIITKDNKVLEYINNNIKI